MATESYTMKLFLVFLLFIFSTRPASCSLRNLDKFEFGQNVGRITFSTSGSIRLLEKIKRVSVIVPECTELKYVRVDINNRFGPPAVKFDWETRTVIMEYNPLAYSVSQYTITAKTVPIPYCGAGQDQQQYVPMIPLTID